MQRNVHDIMLGQIKSGTKKLHDLNHRKKAYRKGSKQRHQRFSDGETDFLSFSLASMMISVPRRYHVLLFNSLTKNTPLSHLLQEQ